MSGKLRAFGAFWYDFIIGDDWRVALGVVLAFAGTYVVSHTIGTGVWWIIVGAVAVVLPASIYRAIRRPR